LCKRNSEEIVSRINGEEENDIITIALVTFVCILGGRRAGAKDGDL
jgi:hypothetical protein